MLWIAGRQHSGSSPGRFLAKGSLLKNFDFHPLPGQFISNRKADYAAPYHNDVRHLMITPARGIRIRRVRLMRVVLVFLP